MPRVADRRGEVHVAAHRQVLVFASVENPDHDRCVDFFSRPDSTFGFEEFRRDVEDGGVWTPVAYYSACSFPTRDAAEAEALKTIPWLRTALPRPKV